VALICEQTSNPLPSGKPTSSNTRPIADAPSTIAATVLAAQPLSRIE
jgi:hypothetical protein